MCAKKNSVIGILGGAGPEATIDFQKKLLLSMQKRLMPISDNDYIRVITDNNTTLINRDHQYISAESSCKENSLILKKLNSLRYFEALNVSAVAIPCNSAHVYFDSIQSQTSLEIVHIIEGVAEYLIKNGCKKVGLLSSLSTYKSGLYNSYLSKYGITVCEPSRGNQIKVAQIIYLLKAGLFNDAKPDFKKYRDVYAFNLKPVLSESEYLLLDFSHPKDLLRLVIDDLLSNQVCDVILGCTELPLIIDYFRKFNGNFIDVNELYADKVLKKVLEMEINHFDKTEISKKNGVGRANGTFGELLQGVLPGNKNFMVTFPVNLYSTVTFYPDKNSSKITAEPSYKVKSIQFAKHLLAQFNIETGGRLVIQSDIKEGKGLASSSADLVATAYAICDAYSREIDEETISSLIRLIEPSDGVMYNEIVSYDYKKLQLINKLGNLPSLTIIGIDEGEQICTIEYNSRSKHYSPERVVRYATMLKEMSDAVRYRNLRSVGRISTESALLNEAYNEKKDLRNIINICGEIGGLGISVAHSGTFIGILLDPREPSYPQKYKQCIEKLKKLNKKIEIYNSIDFRNNIRLPKRAELALEG